MAIERALLKQLEDALVAHCREYIQKFAKTKMNKKVYAFATHGIFSAPAIERIEDSPLDSVVVTDTVPIDPLTKPERVTVITVADILAETIHNVFADDSVSAIFGDMNALF